MKMEIKLWFIIDKNNRIKFLLDEFICSGGSSVATKERSCGTAIQSAKFNLCFGVWLLPWPASRLFIQFFLLYIDTKTLIGCAFVSFAFLLIDFRWQQANIFNRLLRQLSATAVGGRWAYVFIRCFTAPNVDRSKVPDISFGIGGAHIPHHSHCLHLGDLWC